MTHLGKTKNVVVSLINDETILASIFDNNTTSETISRVVIQHTDVMRKALASIGGNTANGLFDGPESAGSDPDDDFEKRTNALVQSMENEQPPVRAEPLTIKHQPVMQEVRREPAEMTRVKRTPLAPAASSKHPEINRPPDTQVLVSESPLSSKDYEVYSLHESNRFRAFSCASGARASRK